VNIPNLRDVGAVSSASVPLRTGVLYRSADLATVDSSRAVGELGIRTVVDLRTEAERAIRPDALPNNAEAVVADVLADERSAVPASARTALDDPGGSAEHVRADEVEQHMLTSYEQFVTLPSARRAYATLFSRIADAGNGPLLFHCAVGKDRTGWATAVLHQLAGLDHDEVMAEYLAVRDDVLALSRPVVEQFERAGGRADDILPMVDVRPSYLNAAVAAMASHYGDVNGYLTVGLGLDASTVNAARSTLIEYSAARQS